MIGVFGDAAVTGKPVGGDLREGKPTPLLARAVAAADAARSAPCSTASVAADLDADEVARIQQVIVDTGALGELERTVADLADVAIRALTSIDITDEAHGELAALADFVATRGE